VCCTCLGEGRTSENDIAVSTTSADWLAGCYMQGQLDAECSSSMSDVETRIVMNLQVSWVAEGAAASGSCGGGRLAFEHWWRRVAGGAATRGWDSQSPQDGKPAGSSALSFTTDYFRQYFHERLDRSTWWHSTHLCLLARSLEQETLGSHSTSFPGALGVADRCLCTVPGGTRSAGLPEP
jgi:hypothetical protein